MNAWNRVCSVFVLCCESTCDLLSKIHGKNKNKYLIELKCVPVCVGTIKYRA